MFELVRAYELAKSEENKLLRAIYVTYTKWKLKHCFFKKFDIYNMKFERNLFLEVTQMYRCTNAGKLPDVSFPILIGYSWGYIQSDKVIIRYGDFNIKISTFDNTFYKIEIINLKRNEDSYTMQVDDEYINLSPLRIIIFTAIYNYCVMYIYGKDSNLFNTDEKYAYYLNDLFI